MHKWISLVTVIAAALLQSACAQAPTESPPTWLQARIAHFESFPASRPPRSISLTTHRGQPVYYVPRTCCDTPSELYDEKGELLCFPSGGFAGGDGRCPDFILRSNLLIVWRDARPAELSLPAAPQSK